MSDINNEKYDVIVVGAGISGAIIANELGKAGHKVLILEAGKGDGLDYYHYQHYNDQFYKAVIKVPNSPYPRNQFAPAPDVLDTRPINGNPITNGGYFVQMGPMPFLSDYTRAAGGTTLHWLGTCLRNTPNDFKAKTLYNRGVDWPVSYEDLMPYYNMAEYEIGVSGDVRQNDFLGIRFDKDYVFPMEIPQSYIDRYIAERTKGMEVEMGGEKLPIKVTQTPQGRNGMPNPKYNIKGKKIAYTPVGAVGNPEMGQRCEGNANCVPICPIQAKYNANKTVDKAIRTGNVTIMVQSVVSTLGVDPVSGQVSTVNFKRYGMDSTGQRTTIQNGSVSGKIVILAAHTVENAKILLASNAGNSSGLVGQNLMDHLVMLTWGLFPDPLGTFRGPGSTSGIESLRDGAFRRQHASFRVEIDNWGWNWAANAPESTLVDGVDRDNLFGKQLRNYMKTATDSQFRFGWELEQLPSAGNNVTIDPTYVDDLGNYRPVIRYNIDDYTRAGAAAAMQVSTQIFQRMAAKNFTAYSPASSGYFEYQGNPYAVNGAGHLVGTHRMGHDSATSVVNSDQRSWDHNNLYVTGCGSHPTIATANPTLTMAALAFKSAEAIRKHLKSIKTVKA